jgi:hypothetical protein
MTKGCNGTTVEALEKAKGLNGMTVEPFGLTEEAFVTSERLFVTIKRDLVMTEWHLVTSESHLVMSLLHASGQHRLGSGNDWERCWRDFRSSIAHETHGRARKES